MKKLTAFLVIGFFVTANILKAQTKIREGKLKMEMSFMDSISEEQKEVMKFMPTEYTTYFKNGNMRTESKSQMGMMITFRNNKSEDYITCADMMGKKIAMHSNKNSMKKIKSMASNDKPEIKYSDETKVIAGINCKKAEVTYKNKLRTTDVWYTNELEVVSLDENNIEGLKGFPMEFKSMNNGKVMYARVTSFEKLSVPDSLFIIPEGYKTMYMDSMMNQGKNLH